MTWTELAVCQQTFKKYAGRGLAGKSLACSVCTAEQYSPVYLEDAAAVDLQCIWSFVVAGLWECAPRGFRQEDIGFYCMFFLIFKTFSCRTKKKSGLYVDICLLGFGPSHVGNHM